MEEVLITVSTTEAKLIECDLILLSQADSQKATFKN